MRRRLLAGIARARGWFHGAPGTAGFGLKRNFALMLAALTLVLAVLGWGGLSGLASGRGSLQQIYKRHLADQRTVYQLGGQLDDAEELILRGWVDADRGARAQLAAHLVSHTLPAVELGIAAVSRATADNRGQAKLARRVFTGWMRFKVLWGQGQWGSGPSAGRSPHAQAVIASLEGLNGETNQIIRLEDREAAVRYRQALAVERSSRRAMISALIAGLLLSLGIVAWLTRSLLRRILRFSRFARNIANGDYSHRLSAGARDELDHLGQILDQVIDSHARAEEYDRSQLEFTDALQLAQNDREAHHLLHRHLERTIPGAVVTVFNRNNSGDQLEAVTPIPPGSPLCDGLIGASPGDCLSIRAAAEHIEDPEHDPLVHCALCRAVAGRSTCVPLLVGGEVIGSVQVKHQAPLENDETRRVRESVRQAAPVIANLRNLAIAQTRASVDELTGLPNRRAMDDTVRRMVAQADRTGLPLIALMLDLDHFKDVNDRLGHAKGDDALAAVGAALTHVLRSSDFAARYGGEEFLILLPDTGIEGGMVVAEKIRRAVNKIRLTSERIRLTASIGLAALPDHATDAEELRRAADQALYAAKIGGRNRVETASLTPESASDRPGEPAIT